jgi:hypothetical protein
MPKKAEVPAKVDPHLAEKRELVNKLIGERPYTKAMYINEVCFFLQRSADSIIEAGKRLLVIQEKEGYGAFIKVVENEIGIPRTTAYRFMNAALKSGKFPAIDFSHFGKSVTKVYTLIEAPEEELKKFEQLGLFAGKNVDELMAMSNKELRELVKSLREDVGEIIKEEVRKVKAKADQLQHELKEYHRIIPPAMANASRAEKQLLYAQAKYDEFEAALSALSFGGMEIEDIKIGAKIEGLLKTCHARICHLADKWENHKKGIVK